MKAFLLLLLSKPAQNEVEQAVQKDDYQDEYVAVVLGLVDSHYEAVAFHD